MQDAAVLCGSGGVLSLSTRHKEVGMLLAEAVAVPDYGPWGALAVGIAGVCYFIKEMLDRLWPKKIRQPLIKEDKNGSLNIIHDPNQTLHDAVKQALDTKQSFALVNERCAVIEGNQKVQGERMEGLCDRLDGVEKTVDTRMRAMSHDVRGLNNTISNLVTTLLGRKSD